MGAQDSESTSLTDEDACPELEGTISSQECSAATRTKGIDFSRTSLESSASLEGLFRWCCHISLDRWYFTFFPYMFYFYKRFAWLQNQNNIEPRHFQRNLVSIPNPFIYFLPVTRGNQPFLFILVYPSIVA